MDNVCKVKSADGTPIAYRRSGHGRPVILVGGAFSTAESEAPLAELLAPRFEVITYDRRGRGASGDTAPYLVRREVEDLAALIAAVGGSASLHGISSGAALVLEAATAGLPITQLALYEPPYVTDPAVLPESAEYTERLTDLLARGRRDDAVELYLSVSETPPESIAGMRRAPMWPGLAALAHTLAYDNAVMGSGLVPTERLATIRTRAMITEGGCSPAPLRKAAKAVATALPRGRHRTLTGQTHEVTPQVLAPVLEEFFAA
ncbi:alpha/beta fold hydrolase [Streptomyces sp. NPDC088116]|uniref:alpha/beta fold hydrolase n=1 Tax=Streptomyces sp. NPDC088116 TaxID=3365825 RepID=UPI0037F84BD2